MNRRKFIGLTGMGIVAATLPVSISAFGNATHRSNGRNGRLNLSYMPYELQLKHSFNLARSSRTTTPDVQVEIEYDGIIGYGEACSKT